MVLLVGVRQRGGVVTVLDLGARGRLRGLDLVNVVAERVPVVVFLVVLVVFLGRGEVVVAAGNDLDARRVFLFAVVLVARVVADGDSFPKIDGDVSLAFDGAGRGEGDAGGRREGDAAGGGDGGAGGGCGARGARRRRGGA